MDINVNKGEKERQKKKKRGHFGLVTSVKGDGYQFISLKKRGHFEQVIYSQERSISVLENLVTSRWLPAVKRDGYQF